MPAAQTFILQYDVVFASALPAQPCRPTHRLLVRRTFHNAALKSKNAAEEIRLKYFFKRSCIVYFDIQNTD
ncbi:hypothetical protein DX927_16510 [Bacillus swezeyi]|uniref:Uncharacterized protein n=1 Tax=Bacillus swezeyi TaxID=1925020 RepID=A0A5M8RLJ7_9BACI|nr:hypothetical protein DX927_16510 [Bacillus swezeyi]